MPSRVEFLGVPGAGKSSLFPEAIGELRSAGVAAAGIDDAVYATLRVGMQDRFFGPAVRYGPRRVGRRFYRQLAARSQDRMIALREFMLEQPHTVTAVLDALESRRDIDPRQDLALGWLLELLWKYQITNGPGATVPCLVFDEGFANRAVSLFGYRFSDDDLPLLRRYIERIPKPDLVIVVTVDAASASSRATERIRFSHLSDEEAATYTRSAADCVDVTSRLLAERGVDVQEVRNDSTLAAVSFEVRAAVRDWLDRAS